MEAAFEDLSFIVRYLPSKHRQTNKQTTNPFRVASTRLTSRRKGKRGRLKEGQRRLADSSISGSFNFIFRFVCLIIVAKKVNHTSNVSLRVGDLRFAISDCDRRCCLLAMKNHQGIGGLSQTHLTRRTRAVSADSRTRMHSCIQPQDRK